MNIVYGKLLKRYKRFFADVLLDSGDIVTAYCPNTGKLLGVPENAVIALTDHGADTKRKLRYAWEWFKDADTWVGMNTNTANDTVLEILTNKCIPALAPYPKIRREVKYGTNSRVDFLLSDEENTQTVYLEVKSVHMKRNGHAQFPDCPTERGAKHMFELSQVVNESTRAIVLYLVQRDDCDIFSIAADLDPKYKTAADLARTAGVEIIAVAIAPFTEINLDTVKVLALA